MKSVMVFRQQKLTFPCPSHLRIPREHFGLQSATGPYVCGHGGITTVNFSPDLHAVYTAGM